MKASAKDPDPITSPTDERDDIEAQLHETLRQDLSRRLKSRRPLLSHLNADTTWLLSVPVPPLESSPYAKSKKRKRRAELESDLENGHRGGDSTDEGAGRPKAYFHILIDPWLKGSQSDVAEFFSQQWHAQESAVQTIAEVEEVIGGIEDLASSHEAVFPSHPAKETPRGTIDLVVVSHEFTDHCHKPTLLELPPSVPVFAAFKAASLIKSWKHFDTVVTLPTNLTSSRDWRTTSVSPLPPWLGIARLGQDKVDLLYYHSAVLIAFRNADEIGKSDEVEAVIYTPHGITPEDLRAVTIAEPRIRTLALLHGLHDIRIGPQLNLGAHNGLLVQRQTAARYWVATHDEVKRGGGLVSWVLKRKIYTVKDAIEKMIEEKKGNVDESLRNVHFEELGNGESLLLE